MNSLGLCMSGTEAAFERHLKSVRVEPFPFTYLEIGVGHGATFFAVLNEFRALGWDIRATAVDIIHGPWMNPQVFMDRAADHKFHLDIKYSNSLFATYGFNQVATIYCFDPEADRYPTDNQLFIDFCLIDGCHGAACVTKDFLSVERAIRPGGIVAFHDAGDWEQGESFQPHCGETISVRRAVKELGLLEGNRDGWGMLEDVPGNKQDDGNGFVFVIRDD